MLVGAWALAAVFVAVHRPREPLAEIMALAATVGALRARSAPRSPGAASPPTPSATSAPGSAASSVALLPAVGLHLVLGLPDGALALAAAPALVRRGLRARARWSRSTC